MFSPLHLYRLLHLILVIEGQNNICKIYHCYLYDRYSKYIHLHSECHRYYVLSMSCTGGKEKRKKLRILTENQGFGFVGFN